jgi:hypothetical protein
MTPDVAIRPPMGMANTKLMTATSVVRQIAPANPDCRMRAQNSPADTDKLCPQERAKGYDS